MDEPTSNSLPIACSTAHDRPSGIARGPRQRWPGRASASTPEPCRAQWQGRFRHRREPQPCREFVPGHHRCAASSEVVAQCRCCLPTVGRINDRCRVVESVCHLAPSNLRGLTVTSSRWRPRLLSHDVRVASFGRYAARLRSVNSGITPGSRHWPRQGARPADGVHRALRFAVSSSSPSASTWPARRRASGYGPDIRNQPSPPLLSAQWDSPSCPVSQPWMFALNAVSPTIRTRLWCAAYLVSTAAGVAHV